jgi:hypothetical protein
MRARPTFAAWSKISTLAVTFSFAVGAAMLGVVFNQISDERNCALSDAVSGVNRAAQNAVNQNNRPCSWVSSVSTAVKSVAFDTTSAVESAPGQFSVQGLLGIRLDTVKKI